jgi:hypothetical protein
MDILRTYRLSLWAKVSSRGKGHTFFWVMWRLAILSSIVWNKFFLKAKARYGILDLVTAKSGISRGRKHGSVYTHTCVCTVQKIQSRFEKKNTRKADHTLLHSIFFAGT